MTELLGTRSITTTARAVLGAARICLYKFIVRSVTPAIGARSVLIKICFTNYTDSPAGSDAVYYGTCADQNCLVLDRQLSLRNDSTNSRHRHIDTCHSKASHFVLPNSINWARVYLHKSGEVFDEQEWPLIITFLTASIDKVSSGLCRLLTHWSSSRCSKRGRSNHKSCADLAG
ncbi:hypothetical protein CEXT_767161 [Caerostris extrusa]|uniref:Uncharacterized protein n=1 Tax=Caerostris extrusa TaxID=172846 RepID=A0AAV4P286_CAEEX|nr:hypothetical protein CEXT_767161 [Caerostris extrusa]